MSLDMESLGQLSLLEEGPWRTIVSVEKNHRLVILYSWVSCTLGKDSQRAFKISSRQKGLRQPPPSVPAGYFENFGPWSEITGADSFLVGYGESCKGQDFKPLEVNAHSHQKGEDWKACGVWQEVGNQCLSWRICIVDCPFYTQNKRPTLCMGLPFAPSRSICNSPEKLRNRPWHEWAAQPGALSLIAGIKRNGIQPKGRAKALVNQQDLRQLSNRRVGIEARIAHLKTRGLGRSRMKSDIGDLISGYRSALSYNLTLLMRDLSLRHAVLR